MSLNHRLAENDPNRNSIQWQAERELLPSFLGVDDIAELWADDGIKFPKGEYVRVLKEDIEDGKLACMTIEQWITLSEERRKRLSHTRPPKIAPTVSGNNSELFLLPIESVSHGTTSTDLVPEDRVGGWLGDTSGMPDHEKKMAARLYMVNRTEFKKWLQKKKKWPLPEECLLARWWDSDEGDEEANNLQTAATKQQEKAIQVLIKSVLKKNNKASNKEIWNSLNNEENEIIVKLHPERIEGNINDCPKDAYIEYRHPIRGTIYKQIRLSAFKNRCTDARKELGLNSKP